jgi:ABC-type sugar transport system ATPase subunit
VALTDIDFEVYPNEVVGLAGDNGAGKSTLMKILAGAVRPSSGTISLNGEPVVFNSPAHAIDLGIRMIYQDLAVAGNIDVVGNVFLGRELMRRACFGLIEVLDQKRMEEEAREALSRVKINIGSLRAEVENLSGGQRQAVAIARAIASQASLIIMDEPTAALGVTEGGQVIELIKDLKQQGTSVVFVSHRLEDICEVCDRVVILKGGRKVAERQIADISRHELRHLIVDGAPKETAAS